MNDRDKAAEVPDPLARLRARFYDPPDRSSPEALEARAAYAAELRAHGADERTVARLLRPLP